MSGHDCAPWEPTFPQTETPVFGRRMCLLDQEALAKALMAEVPRAAQGTRLIVTMNLDHVVQLQKNAAFRQAYDRAFLATIDGSPVSVVSKLKGLKVPRITGTDLLESLLAQFDPAHHRPFFVVSREETGQRLLELLSQRGFTAETFGFTAPPFGIEKDLEASRVLAAQIKAHGTTHLVFGIGAPKSEIWIDQWRDELGDLYAFCFGSGPDFIVGLASRAPKLFQDLGAEWLWRLLTEPQRLWKRYLVNSWPFLPAAWREITQRS